VLERKLADAKAELAMLLGTFVQPQLQFNTLVA